jgi:AraC-like DNA-binding protein
MIQIKFAVYPAPTMTRMRRYSDPDTELRIGATLALPDVLRELGSDPATLLAEVGFDLALFEKPDNRISFANRARIVNHCAARTGCPHLGLLVGQKGGLHSLGLVGLLVKYSPDVGTALRNLIHYFHLNTRGAVPILKVDDHLALLCYLIYATGGEASGQVGDGAVAAIFNILQDLCGPDWKPTEVRFAHRQPKNTSPYQRFFRVPLVFDAEVNAVVFNADWLERPLANTDAELMGLLLEKIQSLEAWDGDSLPAQVRRVLGTVVLTGDARSDKVAALFSMHSRTLGRHLKKFDTSFEELLNEVRYEIARQLLEDSRMPVSQIALTLHYADASAFTRAFKRWSGTTPAQWREERCFPERASMAVATLNRA